MLSNTYKASTMNYNEDEEDIKDEPDNLEDDDEEKEEEKEDDDEEL